MDTVKPTELILRDKLAIDRTHLANERTFLAYFRSSLVILATGFTFLKVDFFSDLRYIAVICLVLGPLVLIFGLVRLLKTRKKILGYYK